MKNNYNLLLVFLLFPFLINAQTKVSGKISDAKMNPIPGANIYIKDSYDGGTSKVDGTFSFKTNEKGAAVLIASFIGYKKYESNIDLKKGEMKIDIILEEEITQLNAVVVSAGSFEASDERKGVILKPLDVLTTGSTADLYSSLNTLPGAQTIGETEGLFVRGGSAAESKTIIDEMIVQKPFSSSVPDLPSRGRFSPMMFKGTVFSTGGYSAQYGQALSSALILKTQDMPNQTITAVNLMVLGFGGAHTQVWDKTAFSVEGGYYNLNPYNNVFKQRVDWDRSPSSLDLSANFRQRITKNGLLKAFVSYSKSDLSLYLPDLDNPPSKTFFRLKPENYYSNVSYRDIVGDWNLFGGFSYSLDKDKIDAGGNKISQDQSLIQGKFTANKKIFDTAYLTFGAEVHNTLYDDTYNQFNVKLEEVYTAGFAESDVYFTNDIAAKVGLRTEYSKILNKFNIAPRISFAYRLGNYDQLNFAYGRFYQTPEKNYLVQYDKFDYENADHYIANYQYIGEDKTFRIELYYKQYRNLVKGTIYSYPYFNLPVVPFSNDGNGYAKGIDIFWRDSRTLKYCDYWVSYSYLDTKREFSNYPTQAFPTFAAPHTFSVVFKRWFESISAYLAFTYIHASGRPYFNPNNPEFLGDRANSYNNLSMNISFIANWFNNYSVIFVSIDNIPGFANVYGYRYSSDGRISNAVVPPTLRSLFLGIFISIGQSNQNQ
ncbi:MAG: TonB-dependent receptor [Ignavibacteriae bacterium HGW-Ignavibacteriae-3]|nr:MAG: TonB-dependent receptor [Ignavibacteriae bacterium HGW-Ignavibacteriae-3]